MLNVEANKWEFLELLKSITREGAAVDKLGYKLTHSDFFTAPCSLKNHLAVPGGVCFHSLNTYKQLKLLCDTYCPGKYSEDTIKIVGLLHDLDLMDKYEITSRNVKKYSETGSKKDELGRFDWVAERGYAIREPENRFVYGHHGQNSEYLISGYIPLTLEESQAVNNHMGGAYEDYRSYDLSAIFAASPLAALLHAADFISSYILDKDE